MPKYRLLTAVELSELEKEFVQYLVVNGITAEDWEDIKKNKINRAEEILSLFSDVVFEGVLRKIKFIDFKSENSLKSFQCLSNEMVLVGLDVDKSINLLDVKQFNKMLVKMPDSAKIYTSSKKYHKQREVELFEMLSNGCEIANGNLFKSLCLVVPSR